MVVPVQLISCFHQYPRRVKLTMLLQLTCSIPAFYIRGNLAYIDKSRLAVYNMHRTLKELLVLGWMDRNVSGGKN